MRRQKYVNDSNSFVKFLVLIGAVMSAVLLGLILMFGQLGYVQEVTDGVRQQEIHPENVVAITMSSSRPGCETTGCYMPTVITIDSGDTITWINEDRGLHTVTTGYYDVPDGMVESEQISPEDKFSFTFAESGRFHYYCRLHPWMEGTIIVN